LKALGLKKISKKLDPVTIEQAFVQHDPAAMNEVADTVIRMVNGAINELNIREKFGYDVMNDFRGRVLTKLFDYSLERFDPKTAELSTFIYTHTKNEWINFQKQLMRQLKHEQSMETPMGEEGMTLEETLADPSATDFMSAMEAEEMYEELKNTLKDPRYQEVLRLWVDDTALNDELGILGLPIAEQARDARQKSKDIAKVINSKFPDNPLGSVRVDRVIRDFVKPAVLKRFPDLVPGIKPTKVPIESPVAEEEETPEDLEFNKETELKEEPYIPLEQRPAPLYRIDPLTGERTRISLNLRYRKVKAATKKYAEDILFNTLMTWLRMELNGKLR